MPHLFLNYVSAWIIARKKCAWQWNRKESCSGKIYSELMFNPRQPREVPPPCSFLAIAPEPFQLGSWNLPWLNPHSSQTLIFFSFSGQVRSLTYDVIRKHPHGYKMPQLRNAANDRQCFSGRGNFRKWLSPGSHILYISDFSCRWFEVRSVT